MSTFNNFTSMSSQVINVTPETLDNIVVDSNCVGLIPSQDLLEITGFQQPQSGDGSILWVRNRSTTSTIILKINNVGSEAQNQIKRFDGLDFAIEPKKFVILMWDGAGWWAQ
jgi:hypothetical protein